MKYLANVVTLEYRPERCRGCGMCVQVCPQAVFRMTGGKAELADRDACMECGACQLNCAFDAIAVRAGVGCAQAVLNANAGQGSACCGDSECSCDAQEK